MSCRCLMRADICGGVEVLPSRTHDTALPLIDETHKGIRQIDDWTPNLLAGGEDAAGLDEACVGAFADDGGGGVGFN